MNFKSITESKPEEGKVAIFLAVDATEYYEVILGYVKDNQFYLPDGYPLTELKPVSWHELPTLPEGCKFFWEP